MWTSGRETMLTHFPQPHLLQVQLQNMMTSKFVGYFLEQVSSWQKKLATADSVITIWLEVQSTWSHIESIFIGSEDIRAQLPEHSKQFDTIDTNSKVTCHAHLVLNSQLMHCSMQQQHGASLRKTTSSDHEDRGPKNMKKLTEIISMA